MFGLGTGVGELQEDALCKLYYQSKIMTATGKSEFLSNPSVEKIALMAFTLHTCSCTLRLVHDMVSMNAAFGAHQDEHEIVALGPPAT